MDFKKRIVEQLNLSKIQAETMLADYVNVCEKLAKEYHQEQLRIDGVSGLLPTSEELQEIVVKIAYSQQGEEQDEDCYAKMGILHEFISKYVNSNNR